GSTYALTSADVGSTIRVNVTGTNTAGNATASSSPTTTVAAAPPANSTPPTITGTTQDGQTLTASNGTWSGTGPINFTYQWGRCDSAGANCVDLASATSSTYQLASGDVGNTIRVKVTGTNAGGNATATSAQTAVVAPSPPANTVPPTI